MNEPSTSSASASCSMSSDIYLFKLIESHCREIDSINTECKTKLPKLMSQRLPRYMRRRASSHNPKRIPRSVRQSSSGKTNEPIDKTKNKNKGKHVNKKKQKISLKKRSQRTDRSVLHIWFAKRFQMKMCWNRLIPELNRTKNQRTLYHKSKNDFTLFHLSVENCIEINYSNCSQQEVTAFMSKLIHKEIGLLFTIVDDREVNSILCDPSDPSKCLAPVKLICSQNSYKLWIWSHISVCETIISTLTQLSQKDYSNKIVIKSRNDNFERFRVIGPKALHLLSQCLNFDFNNQLKFNETKSDSIHYFRSEENAIISISSRETTLFNRQYNHWSSGQRSRDFEFIVIIKNHTYNNRFAIDLIVSSDSAKTLWHRITENKCHRVGGLRDLTMTALNTSSLFFPHFGFIDHRDNETRLQKLKQLFNSVNEEIAVLRNRSLIHKLSQDMSSDNLNQIIDSLESKDKLINIELICIDRGVPQELDHICLPEDEEIQTVFDVNSNQNVNNYMELNDKSHERKVIGLIEFGTYSLETSRGKGLGVVSAVGLKELIAINENIKSKYNYKNKRIIVTFKSLKSGLYRMAFIKVIDSVFSV